MQLIFQRLRRSLAPVAILFLCPFFGMPDVQAGLPEAVQRVKPSVVAVGTFQKTRSPAFVFLGTGFAVGDGTLVATNAHVAPVALEGQSEETLAVLVRAPGGSDSEVRGARVVARDEGHDLALLRITGARLPAVTLGNSNLVREGQSIAFTGFPVGQVLGFLPVTHHGIVASLTPIALPAPSAKRLDANVAAQLRAPPITLFQLDATIYAGHSGSPVYDDNTGEVLGIVNMGHMRGMKDPVVGQAANISFAVPVRHLKELIENTR